jgi:hypothetical protein
MDKLNQLEQVIVWLTFQRQSLNWSDNIKEHLDECLKFAVYEYGKMRGDYKD